MSTPTLSSLLEQSRRLTQTQSTPLSDLPAIQLGFEQLASQSRRIGGKGTTAQNASGNAYYLLASGGVNADQLSTTINSVNLAGTFEPLLPLSDTDVEGYLRHTHEQTIISSIEEGRRQTTVDFYKNLDHSMRRDWERQKEKLFEELGRHQASGAVDSSRRKVGGFERNMSSAPPLSAASSLQMNSRMMRYDRVVRRLNEFRKQGYAFGLISALGEASIGSAADSKSTQMTDSWRLLSHLVRERDVLNGEFQRTSITERQYARAYSTIDQESLEAVELRKMITEGAKEHLEEQFMSYVEKTLASKPAEANLGGIPSMQNKIRAFLSVKYQKMGQWTNLSLEIANNTPIWARIYYLLRSGHAREALEYATENESHIQKLEKNFVLYLKAWLDSPDRRLPRSTRDLFLAEYNQRIRYVTDTSDPYKHALYKLIGRVELTRRNIPGVAQTAEDWMWFQLSQVRENEGEGETPHERYGLRDLGRLLVKFGEAHFDPKGSKPSLYFQVLLLSGQFERAIAFLHQTSQYQADAVHFAITLTYYGLMRIPSRAMTSDVDLLVLSQDGAGDEIAYLNFSRLLYRYTRPFVQTDAPEAVHYLYLICLNADLDHPIGSEQVSICHDYIRELVMETRKYGELLGDIRQDGTKIPGMLERDLKLLHLKDEKTYLLGIVKTAAQRADQEKRFRDAILLYNIAEEYDSVISVLNIELGASLSRPVSTLTSSNEGYFNPAIQNPSLSVSVGTEDVVQIARQILDHYDRMASVSGQVGRKNRETCEVLLRLKEAMILYEQGKLDHALASIEAINIIPLHSDLVEIIKSVEAFNTLDEAIVRNFDVILLTTMNLLYKIHGGLKESPYGDASRQQTMTELRQKARSLMMFAGMLRYRLTSDTYASLTRLDVFIH